MSTREYAGIISTAANGVQSAQQLVGMQAAMLGAAAAGDVASLVIVLQKAGSPVPQDGKLPSESLLLSAQRHAAVLLRLILHQHAHMYGSAADQAAYGMEGAYEPPAERPSSAAVGAMPGGGSSSACASATAPGASSTPDGRQPDSAYGPRQQLSSIVAPTHLDGAPAAAAAASPSAPGQSSPRGNSQQSTGRDSGATMPPPPRRTSRSAASAGSTPSVSPAASPASDAPQPPQSALQPAAGPKPRPGRPSKAAKSKLLTPTVLSGQGGGTVRSVRRTLPHLPFMHAPTSLLWPACLAAPSGSDIAVPLSLLQGLALHAAAQAAPAVVPPGASVWQRALVQLLQLPAPARTQLLCTSSALVHIQMTQFSTGHRYSQAVRSGMQGWGGRLKQALQAGQGTGAAARRQRAVASASDMDGTQPLAGSVEAVVGSIKATAPWSIHTVLRARAGELQHQRRCARVMAAAARAHSLLRAAPVGGAGTAHVLASSGLSGITSVDGASKPSVQQLLHLDADDDALEHVYTPLHCSGDLANGASSSTMQGQLASLVAEFQPSDEPLGPCVAHVALHAMGPALLAGPEAPVQAPVGELRGVPHVPDARGPHAGARLPQCPRWRASDCLPAQPTDSARAAGSSSTGGHGGGGTLQLQPAVATVSRTLPKFVQRDVTALLGGTDPSDLRSTDVSFALYLAQCTLAHPAVDALLRSAEDLQRAADLGSEEDAVLERRLSKAHVAAQLAAASVVDSASGARAAVEAVQCGVHPVIVCTSLPNEHSAGDDKKSRLRSDPQALPWTQLQARADPAVLQALKDEGAAGADAQALPSDLHSGVPDSWQVTTAASVEEALAVVQVQNAQLLGMLQRHPAPSGEAAAPGASSVMQGTLARAFGDTHAAGQDAAGASSNALLETLPLAAAARPLLRAAAAPLAQQAQGGSPPRLAVGSVDSMLATPPASPAAASALGSPSAGSARSAQRLDGGTATRRTKKQAASLASVLRSAGSLPIDQRQPDTVGAILMLQALRQSAAPAHWPARLHTLWARRSMWLAARCMTFLTKSTQGKKPWGTQTAAFMATTLMRPVSVNHLKLVKPFRLPLVTPPPRRAAWVSLRRNFFQEDDTTLHYKPYFGDDDERELDLTGYSHSKVHTAITATQSDGSVLAADTVGAEFTSSELQGAALSGSPLADMPSVGGFAGDGTPVPSPVAEEGEGPLCLSAIMNADAMAAPGVASQLASGEASALSQRLHRSGVMGSTAHRVMLLELVTFLSEALGYAAPPPPPSHPMVSSKFQADQRATTRDGVTYSASDAEEEAGRAFKQVRHCLALLVHCAGDSVLRSLLFPGVTALEDGARRKGAAAQPAVVRLDAAGTNNVYCSSDFAVLSASLKRMRQQAPAGPKRGRRPGKAKAGSGRKQPKRGRGSDDSGSVLSPSALDDDCASVATSVSGSVRGEEEDSASASLGSAAGGPALVWSSDMPLLLAALVERWREVHATAARFRLCASYGLLPRGHPLRCLPLLPSLRADAMAGTAALLAAMAGDSVDSAQRQWLPLLGAARDASRAGGRWAADVGLGDMPPESEAALVPHLLETRGVVSALSVPSAQPWSALHELGAETLGVRANAAMRADMQQALDLPGDGAGSSAQPGGVDTEAGQAEGDGSHETLNVIFCPMTKVYDDRQHGVLHALPTPREGEEITRKRLMHGHYLRNSKLFLLALREAALAQRGAAGAMGGVKRARDASASSSSSASSAARKAPRKDDLPDYVTEALGHLSGQRAAAATRFGQSAGALAAQAAALAQAARLPAPSGAEMSPAAMLTAREAALVPRLFRVAGGDVDAVCAMLGYDAETMAEGAEDPLAVLPKCKRNLRADLLQKAGLQESSYAQLRARVLQAAAVGESADAGAAAADDDADTVISGGVAGAEEEEEAAAATAPPPAPAPASGSGRGRGKRDGGPPAEGGITQSMLTRDAARLVAGEHKRVLVARSDIHGWGAFMGSEGAAARELVYEYRGELISQNEADRRGNIYDRLNMSYLFELSDLSVLDAARKGSKIRFANHSSNPNCAARVMSVLGGQRRIAFFARRNIAPGDELTFNYQYETDHSSAVRDNSASSSGRGRGRKRSRSSKHQSKTPLLDTKGLAGATPTGGSARRGGGGGGRRRRRSS